MKTYRVDGRPDPLYVLIPPEYRLETGTCDCPYCQSGIVRDEILCLNMQLQIAYTCHWPDIMKLKSQTVLVEVNWEEAQAIERWFTERARLLQEGSYEWRESVGSRTASPGNEVQPTPTD